ncbi:MAG TPA: outer membrane beta-barrel protein, partial [Coxiellaceae bacterium]|nr:outer membrane beta-barrel protein [Coxiellaceae bacterium]
MKLSRSLLSLCGIFTFLTLNCSYAATSNSYLDLIHPYVGATLGYDSTNLNMSYMGILESDYGLNGVTYSGYAGLELTPTIEKFSKFRLGAEVFAENLNQATAQDSILYPLDTPVIFQKKNSIGFGVLPGYQITDHNQIYLRVGLAHTQFTYQNAPASGLNYSFYCDGTQIGIGSLWEITKNLGIRAEYDRTNYQSFHATGMLNGFGPDDDYLNFTSNEFKLGLQW